MSPIFDNFENGLTPMVDWTQTSCKYVNELFFMHFTRLRGFPHYTYVMKYIFL